MSTSPYPDNKTFNVDKDIPDLTGKVFLVTGGTSGLGKGSIIQLAKHKPEHIYFTARSSEKAQKVISDIKSVSADVSISFIELDLCSLASVQKGAKQVLQEGRRLDVLIANAGIMNEAPGLTKDGYELQFGTNHLGHALLIQILLPLLTRSSGRIVALTSLGAAGAPAGGIKFDELKTTQAKISPVLAGYVRYGQSKLANILYVREIAHRHPEITTVAVHPGVVSTELVYNRGVADRAFIRITNFILRNPIVTPQEGVWNQLWAATAPKENIQSGSWYEPVHKPGQKVKYAEDDELAKKLYDWTETELAPWME